jgi:hypothetical protein
MNYLITYIMKYDLGGGERDGNVPYAIL